MTVKPEVIRTEIVKAFRDEEALATALQDAIRVNFVEALKDEQVLKAFKAAIKDEVAHFKLDTMTAHLQRVETENAMLRAKVDVLEKKMAQVEASVDMVEQQERKDSVRVFNVPEDVKTVNGEQDDRKWAHELLTTTMGVTHLVDRDLEVVHRIGKLPDAKQISAAAIAGQTLKPRPIIIKFVDRFVKAQVMKKEARAKLAGSGFFISDDLTRRRAHLAFLARLCKRNGLLSDTWVHNSKVWRKDTQGVIKEVVTERDLPDIPPELPPPTKQRVGAAAGANAGHVG